MNKINISQTDPIEGLAEFWQTYDFTDFEDQLKDFTEPMFAGEMVVQIHLQPAELETVKQVARSSSMKYTDLIRAWVLERIFA